MISNGRKEIKQRKGKGDTIYGGAANEWEGEGSRSSNGAEVREKLEKRKKLLEGKGKMEEREGAIPYLRSENQKVNSPRSSIYNNKMTSRVIPFLCLI